MKKVVCFLIICSAVPALGQFDYGFDFSKAGSAGFQFLKIGVGARETAIGNAATAMSNEANTVFWNVGNLGFVDKRQLQLSHKEWLISSSHDAVALALPFGSYVLGLSLISLSIAEFEETTVQDPLRAPAAKRAAVKNLSCASRLLLTRKLGELLGFDG